MINTVYRLIAPGMIDVACTEPDIKNSVILRPEYLSICKADQRYYLGNRSREVLKEKLPMALIHECCARVVFDPTGSYKTGELVVPVPNIPTEDDDIIAENYRAGSHFCSSGYDGFLRDYIDMPPDRLVRVPDGIDPRIASFTELISVAVHAISRFEKFSHSRKNSIGIWGDGNVGFITALILKALYPEAKLYIFGTVYEKLGYFAFADGAYHVDRVPSELKVDHAFECVGGEGSRFALAQIIDLINPEGTVGLMGVSERFVDINTRMVLEKGLCLFGSSRSGINDFQKTMDILAENPKICAYLENLIGNVAEMKSISDIHAAFAQDISRNFGKTVLKWNK
ncbi:MAG: alcohol dehydrogenase catalytic domain-containing protein [Clostridia bacterium]|nr:alcohol dehydrogenase catalytic domain-containing protein [Clostridia bacterium]MBQ4604109.1 alcohol dehydrogenase catalytic domain-containing protein [Clostridia bacterium]